MRSLFPGFPTPLPNIRNQPVADFPLVFYVAGQVPNEYFLFICHSEIWFVPPRTSLLTSMHVFDKLISKLRLHNLNL